MYKKREAKSLGPRSLNIGVRKRETARIEKENAAFAKRLFQNGGSISVRKLDAEFMAQQELKNRIRRAKKPLPGLTGVRATQLPPLDESAFRRTRRSTISKTTLSTTNRVTASQAMFMGSKQASNTVDTRNDAEKIVGASELQEGMYLTNMTGLSKINDLNDSSEAD